MKVAWLAIVRENEMRAGLILAAGLFAWPHPALAQAEPSEIADIAQIVRKIQSDYDQSVDTKAEIAALRERDRYARDLFVSQISRTDLTDDARNALVAWGEEFLGPIDRANTDRLKDIVSEIGWDGVLAAGRRTAIDAWHIVQHASHDREFQRDALAAFEPHAGDPALNSHYAGLYDRLALADERPQRYGRELTCVDGARRALDLEDPDQVDLRRASIGLEPLAEEIASITKAVGPCQPWE